MAQSGNGAALVKAAELETISGIAFVVGISNGYGLNYRDLTVK